MNAFLGLQLFMTAFVCGVVLLVPSMSPQDFLFAVRVPRGFRSSETARSAMRLFCSITILGTALIAVLSVAMRSDNAFIAIIPAAGVVAGAAGFALARRRILPYAITAATVRTAELSVAPDRLPWWTFFALPPLAAHVGILLYLKSHWDEIPDRFPVHWNIEGQVNGYASRTVSGVYGAPLFFAGISVWLILLGLAIFFGARRSANRKTICGLFIPILYVMAWVSFNVGMLPFHSSGPPRLLVVIIPLLLFVGVTVAWGIRQAGRFPSEPTPDEAWRGGVFYCNREDPAMFVEKRSGYGYTINAANPWAWVVLLGFLLSIIAMTVLLVATR
jgi:uncharacterized membrane protein